MNEVDDLVWGIENKKDREDLRKGFLSLNRPTKWLLKKRYLVETTDVYATIKGGCIIRYKK